MDHMPASSPLIALVTGATSGIGRALVEELAAAGVTTAMVGRDVVRAEAERAVIVAATGNASVRVFHADLARLNDVRRLAGEVTTAFERLDLLVHCASVFLPRRTLTVDGFETMFATNHLAPFLLTNLLTPHLRASGRARILTLTAPSRVRLNFDDLQGERRFGALTAFGATKAAELLVTFELARRLQGAGVTANAVHPGLVRTALMRQAPAPLRLATWLLSSPPARAAKAIAPLALSPDYAGRTGLFFKGGREIQAPAYTRDRDIARRLWAVSAELTDLGPTESLAPA